MSQNIDQLVTRLREAASAYYLDQPVMSDAEFDALRDQLAKLDAKNPFLAEVGATITGSPLQKVAHEIPMGSLNKCGGEDRTEEYDSWVRNSLRDSNADVTIQWKLDGVSIELIYENGRFVQAITRGDGLIGEDVTQTIAASAPKAIRKASGRLSVRAEAVLTLSTWKKHFAENFANPRNTIAGIVRRVSDTTQSKHITLLAYDIVGENFTRESDKISRLHELGFDVVETQVCPAGGVPQVASNFEGRREQLDYEVDGVVLKANLLATQARLGEHDGRPKYAIAWKFAAQGGFSTIKGVEWSVGTSGRITPVALIDPIPVAGVTISRVTLHNADEIERLGVQIGDTVEVIRSGDVIPAVVRVTQKGTTRTPIAPKACPSCGANVTLSGPMWVCINESCQGVAFRKLAKWVSKRSIMHLGEVYLRTLYDNGVTTIPGLYQLDQDGLIANGIPGGMASKIYAELQKSRDATLADFIGSLSIDMLGRSEARNLVKLGINTVIDFLSLTPTELMKFDGYKQTKSKRIVDGIQENRTMILSLLPSFNILSEPEPKKVSNSMGKLAGKSFVICLTGTMSRPRKELAALIESHGHRVSDSVGQGVTHLCQADPASQSSKTKKAQKMSIPIINEQQLLDMLA